MAITSKSRTFTPAVVRKIIGAHGKVTNQTQSHLSGTMIDDRSFKFDNPGVGLKSTQQLNVDWSRFENHTFFNSAEAKVNVAFDMIINNFPFDGGKKELEQFFDRLTGFERYVFDLFPKHVGALNFHGAVNEGTYIAVSDRAGTLYPSLTSSTGEVRLDPGEESISFETHIFIPISGDGTDYNENQVICQKLDSIGSTGFTLGLLDSRLKSQLTQARDTSGQLLWWVGGEPVSAIESGYTGKNVDGFPWTEDDWASFNGYDASYEENNIGIDNVDLIFLASSGSVHLSASMELPKGKWSHICATYDRTYGQNNLKLYLDGDLKTTSERSYNMASFATSLNSDDVPVGHEEISFHTSPLLIGSGSSHFKGDWTEVRDSDWFSLDGPDDDEISDGRYDEETGLPVQHAVSVVTPAGISRGAFVPTQTFSGSLDEFRVWHSVRPAAVLKSLADKNVYADNNGTLRLCYRFNEAFGDYEQNDLCLDSSGSGLHSMIQNFTTGIHGSRDQRINRNPVDGRYGDPDEAVTAPMNLEKLEMNPVLFPSNEIVKSLNCQLLDDANWYDVNNPNLITKLIPQHYLLEAELQEGFSNEYGDLSDPYSHNPNRAVPGMGTFGSPQIIASILFTWARYFDEMKMFLDHFVNLMHVDYDVEDTIADTFLPFLSNYYGFDLPKCFSDASLEQYRDGENITPDQGLSDMGLQYVQNQIWRRILVNINEIFKSKGTKQGIKALMLSMGINPDKLFRFREYGGSRTKTLNDVRRNRVEIAAALDFSGTLTGPADHRSAPGIANPFSYGHLLDPYLNPWEIDYLDHTLDGSGPTPEEDYLNTPFITPFMMSPFLSGSRVEVGACNPDSNIPVASALMVLDFTLPGDETLGLSRHRNSYDFLADSTLLDRKVIKIKDIDEIITYFQFITSEESALDDEAFIEINIIGILDRVDIATEIANTITNNTTLSAYNISQDNDGIIKLYQPRGGRAGNYPIELYQYESDRLVPWSGLIQAIDFEGTQLWKRPDIDEGVLAQITNIDGNELYTTDDGLTFTTDGAMVGAVPAYQSSLLELGFDPEPQLVILNESQTAEVGVWKHVVTGKFITYEEHPEYGDTVFGDEDMGAPYEKVLTEQSEESFAHENGYVPVYYEKEYFAAAPFTGGELGIINKSHPDLSYEESLFIEGKGSYHGFDLTPQDGLFTSGSWTVEALYRYENPVLTFFPVTQSLLRIQSTLGPAGSEKHVLLSNLIASREPHFHQETEKEIITSTGSVKLFIRPELSMGDFEKTLELEVTGVNVFDGQQWNISYGRQRADQIGSVVSSSYFLRVAQNFRGNIKRYHEDTSLFLETLHEDNKTFWSNTDSSNEKNEWGPFIAIGTQDLPTQSELGENIGLNSDDLDSSVMCTHFSGKIAQLRFWSKALTTNEFKEHVRNPTSIGVEDPTTNFNFATIPSGSWERMRLDISFDQQVTASIEDEAADSAFRAAKLQALGWLEMFDFSQGTVSGSRGALWRHEDDHNEMKFHMMSYGFVAEEPNIKPERFDFATIDAKFDEQSIDNKVRVRGFEYTHNIEEFLTEVAPVHELLASEIPSDDTRFSIDISSYQALNDDIIKIFATLDSLDNILGAPENVFTTSYPDLEFLRNVYFNRLSDKVNIRSFFEFFRWFDNAVGLVISKLVPRKTHFMGVNFVIESHMLERAKMTYNYSDVYLGDKNRHGLKGTMTLQQLVGQVKRF